MNIEKPIWINEINLEENNKSDTLLKEFTNLIVRQSIPEGYTFPNENVMCELLKIGRGTLREVYKVLELQGLITRSKSGTTVNDINTQAIGGTFDNSLLLSEEENIIEFLLIVEPESAGIAAKKINDMELEKLYKVMMQLESANHKRNYPKMNDYNTQFHQIIREATHNSVLISSIYSSRKQYEKNIIRPLINDSLESIHFMDTCLIQHYNLYYALKNRNSDEAKKIMYEHFMTDLDYLKLCQSDESIPELSSN